MNLQYYYDLHQIPELSFHENQTRNYIKNAAKKFSCLTIEKNRSIYLIFDYGKVSSICFRSELDGLNLKEETSLPFKSKINMHACGHDGHMAILLSLGEYLSLHQFDKNVILLFQVSEENYGGSISVLNASLLHQYHVEEIYALHIWPNLPSGEVFTSKHMMLALATEIDLTLRGKAKHIGDANKQNDALLAGCSLIKKLEKYQRKHHLRLSFGLFNSGNGRNIISDKTTIKGSLRCFSYQTQNALINKIKGEISKIENQYQVQIKLNIRCIEGVRSNKKLLKILKHHVKFTKLRYFQSEDFGNYLSSFKGCYFLLGNGKSYPLHSSLFQINDNILEKGETLFIQILKSL